jgi:hypothetical protein
MKTWTKSDHVSERVSKRVGFAITRANHKLFAEPSLIADCGERGPSFRACGQFSCAKPVGAQKSFPTARNANQSGRPGIGSSLPHCGQATWCGLLGVLSTSTIKAVLHLHVTLSRKHKSFMARSYRGTLAAEQTPLVTH